MASIARAIAKPLRSQLNQIRAWVRQGRTDAWIAHQLEVSTSELREFRRRHELDAEEETDEGDLRDEIEAEIEAATREEELAAEAAADEDEDEDSDDEDSDESDDDEDGERPPPRRRARASGGRASAAAKDDGEDGERAPRRRRRRRGGRGAKRSGSRMQASFDHGKEGYGVWLDPAIADDPVYNEHWADHRQIEVNVEPDRIVITRTDGEAAAGSNDSAASNDSDDSDD